jgi:CheY-like chemotaxis protein
MTFPIAKSVALPVLVIEDEPAVADYVRTALERNGYAVVYSTSGADGVRLLGTGEYLGVISDMHTQEGSMEPKFMLEWRNIVPNWLPDSSSPQAIRLTRKHSPCCLKRALPA